MSLLLWRRKVLIHPAQHHGELVLQRVWGVPNRSGENVEHVLVKPINQPSIKSARAQQVALGSYEPTDRLSIQT